MANITSKGLKKDKSTKVFFFFFLFQWPTSRSALSQKKKSSHSALSLRVPKTPPRKHWNLPEMKSHKYKTNRSERLSGGDPP